MKSVTICSSNRFASEAIKFAEQLRKLGVNVLIPHFYTHAYGGLEKIKDHNKRFLAMGLTHDHFHKIRKSDVTFFYNKGGYSGPSVTLELGYATALNKRTYALSSEDAEVCRDILFEGYAKTPKELLKYL